MKNNRSENGSRYFEEIRRTRIKLILQIGTFRLRTDLSGRPVVTNEKRPPLELSNVVPRFQPTHRTCCVY